jgi:hypothetical protein
MRTFGIIMLCILAVIGSGVAWCKISYPAYTYRYRMTVEVMVDGVMHSASSVVEIKIQTQPAAGSVPPIVPYVHGEAVFVDLGNGRNVFALLANGSNANGVDYALYVVPKLFNLTKGGDQDLVKLPHLRGTREVSPSYPPAFVTFKNLDDPTSARVVNAETFESEFGRNVRLNRVWIEMTNEPVTKGLIEKKLPWLKSHTGYFGGPFDPTWSRPSRNLTGVEFIRTN